MGVAKRADPNQKDTLWGSPDTSVGALKGAPYGQSDCFAGERPVVDTLIVVTSDRDLLDLGPNWNGRLIMRTQHFVRRVVAR